MPVRKIPRNGQSITGRLSCYRSGKSVCHESRLERDFFLLFLFDSEVATVEEQPVKITYQRRDKKGALKSSSYIPDALVTYHARTGRRPLLVEVKYHDQLVEKREELLPKIRAGCDFARRRGWRYRVYTDRHISKGALLTNAKFLRPFMRFPRDEQSAKRLLGVLGGLGRASAETILAACTLCDPDERGQLVACLWWLVAKQEISADLAWTPISMSAPLWITEGVRAGHA